MAIQKIGEKLIKKSIFVEREDYELLEKYSRAKKQSVSATFRELMLNSKRYFTEKMNKIEHERILAQEAIARYEAEVSSKVDISFDTTQAEQQEHAVPGEQSE